MNILYCVIMYSNSYQIFKGETGKENFALIKIQKNKFLRFFDYWCDYDEEENDYVLFVI